MALHTEAVEKVKGKYIKNIMKKLSSWQCQFFPSFIDSGTLTEEMKEITSWMVKHIKSFLFIYFYL